MLSYFVHVNFLYYIRIAMRFLFIVCKAYEISLHFRDYTVLRHVILVFFFLNVCDMIYTMYIYLCNNPIFSNLYQEFFI